MSKESFQPQGHEVAFGETFQAAPILEQKPQMTPLTREETPQSVVSLTPDTIRTIPAEPQSIDTKPTANIPAAEPAPATTSGAHSILEQRMTRRGLLRAAAVGGALLVSGQAIDAAGAALATPSKSSGEKVVGFFKGLFKRNEVALAHAATIHTESVKEGTPVATDLPTGGHDDEGGPMGEPPTIPDETIDWAKKAEEDDENHVTEPPFTGDDMAKGPLDTVKPLQTDADELDEEGNPIIYAGGVPTDTDAGGRVEARPDGVQKDFSGWAPDNHQMFKSPEGWKIGFPKGPNNLSEYEISLDGTNGGVVSMSRAGETHDIDVQVEVSFKSGNDADREPGQRGSIYLGVLTTGYLNEYRGRIIPNAGKAVFEKVEPDSNGKSVITNIGNSVEIKPKESYKIRMMVKDEKMAFFVDGQPLIWAPQALGRFGDTGRSGKVTLSAFSGTGVESSATFKNISLGPPGTNGALPPAWTR